MPCEITARYSGSSHRSKGFSWTYEHCMVSQQSGLDQPMKLKAGVQSGVEISASWHQGKETRPARHNRRRPCMHSWPLMYTMGSCRVYLWFCTRIRRGSFWWAWLFGRTSSMTSPCAVSTEYPHSTIVWSDHLSNQLWFCRLISFFICPSFVSYLVQQKVWRKKNTGHRCLARTLRNTLDHRGVVLYQRWVAKLTSNFEELFMNSHNFIRRIIFFNLLQILQNNSN